MDPREQALDKLEKLAIRLRGGHGTWPPNECSDVATHIAGMWLREHIGLVIEAIRRLD